MNCKKIYRSYGMIFGLLLSISTVFSNCNTKNEVLQPTTSEKNLQVNTSLNTQLTTTTLVDSVNVNNLKIKANGTADVSSLIQALITSKKTIFFPKGTYKINKPLQISGVSNLKISGEPGTMFTTDQNKILSISGNISGLEICSIKFLSSRNSTVNDPEGLIFIANYGDNDVMDNIYIHNCTFTNPYTQANGIKLVSEGRNSLVKNISITYNTFTSIGRMGIEFQNHNRQPNLPRFRDYSIQHNYFLDVGTIQAGPAPSCISVSGYAVNGKIDYNNINNMRMNTSAYIYYGIENAGTINLETIGNHMISSTYGYTGILGSGPSQAESALTGQPTVTNWVIKNNVITLTGSTADKNKIRGMEITSSTSCTIANNTITTDGIALMLVHCQGSIINLNTVKVKAGNAFYFRDGCTKNTLTKNKLDCSQGTDNGVVLFDGATTTNNKASSNTLIKTDNLPGRYVNVNGASNNAN